jgi:hypothetical protein
MARTALWWPPKTTREVAHLSWCLICDAGTLLNVALRCCTIPETGSAQSAGLN